MSERLKRIVLLWTVRCAVFGRLVRSPELVTRSVCIACRRRTGHGALYADGTRKAWLWNVPGVFGEGYPACPRCVPTFPAPKP